MKQTAVITVILSSSIFSALDLSGAENVDTLHTLGEVVVTGTNRAVPQKLLPYTVSIIDNRQLESTGNTQVLSAISGMVPSLFVSQRSIFGFGVSNGGSGHIKLRGVGGDRASGVLMMVDGQPQFAGIYSHHVADFYGTEYADRVEVLRGPGSVLYGSNAMGGVVNVITKNADKDGVHTTLTSQYGSYDTWLSSVTNTVRMGRFSSLVSLGYDRTDGVTDGFDFKQGSLYAKLGYDFSDSWKLRADYSLMNFTGNDPLYPKLSDPESTDIYHQNITRGEASLSAGNAYGNTDGNVRVYYSYGNHYVDDPRHFHSLDDRFGILAYQNFRPWEGASATMGFDFDTYTGEIPVSGGVSHVDNTRPTTIGRKSITEYSPYVTFSQELINGSLTVNAGLRMSNSDRFDTQWIPQCGFAVRPAGGWMIKASLAKGYRNPSFREMYLYATANPELDPETMMNYEVSAGKTFSRYFGFDVTGYYSKGDNMIQVVRQKNVNTGSFINKGVEVSAHSHPADNLTLRCTYSYLYTTIDNLTAAPKNQYFLGVTWRPVARLGVDAEMKGIGGLYVADDVARQNYTLFNIRLSYDALPWLEIFTKLDNITGRHYTINEGYEMPGFTGMGGFRLRF